MKKNGLEPLMCESPEILILGSLPGDKSLELQEYYDSSGMNVPPISL